MKQETIKLFIPARALEYTGDQEYSKLSQKIESAICRYYITGDFFISFNKKDCKIRVFLNKQVFNREALGYEVLASVWSG